MRKHTVHAKSITYLIDSRSLAGNERAALEAKTAILPASLSSFEAARFRTAFGLRFAFAGAKITIGSTHKTFETSFSLVI